MYVIYFWMDMIIIQERKMTFFLIVRVPSYKFSMLENKETNQRAKQSISIFSTSNSLEKYMNILSLQCEVPHYEMIYISCISSSNKKISEHKKELYCRTFKILQRSFISYFCNWQNFVSLIRREKFSYL